MRVVVLFNLKPDTDVAAYEDWARTRDIPGVRALPSIDDFQIYRTTGLLGGSAPAPYQYVEIIDIADMEGFTTDVAGASSQAIAREFKAFLGAEPFFMLTEPLA
ncbi:REDY-like protein HapK [Polymorphobacter sp. PAMC 29334]|uniref:REDY-like protein HapK n=1 Tax=Polymorphobacter sp. PAMC 29334 TaxID=2862331 RepID=UPI001C749AAE|nr:REDY-like protein HapK [Polymorphobacter sp. PAMC 29334]QYE35992.1 REDY-like protein HapK [Polymorphobacter sp. PAMC 29334]